TTHSSRQAALTSTSSSPAFSTVKLSHLLNGPCEMSCCSFSMLGVSLLMRLPPANADHVKPTYHPRPTPGVAPYRFCWCPRAAAVEEKKRGAGAGRPDRCRTETA